MAQGKVFSSILQAKAASNEQRAHRSNTFQQASRQVHVCDTRQAKSGALDQIQEGIQKASTLRTIHAVFATLLFHFMSMVSTPINMYIRCCSYSMSWPATQPPHKCSHGGHQKSGHRRGTRRSSQKDSPDNETRKCETESLKSVS